MYVYPEHQQIRRHNSSVVPKSILFDITKKEDDIVKQINEWYGNIITSDKKNKRFRIINISSYTKIAKYRTIISKLITQSSILDDNINKMLNESNFKEILHIIKKCLVNLSSSEYQNCKLLTLALFSYYKTSPQNESKFIFLYEELNYYSSLWNNEEMWIEWYTQDIEEKFNVELNASDNSIIEEDKDKEALRLLFRLKNIMVELKVNDEMIQRVVLSDIASKYLSAESFIEIKETFD